jgi:hypothetical protein
MSAPEAPPDELPEDEDPSGKIRNRFPNLLHG